MAAPRSPGCTNAQRDHADFTNKLAQRGVEVVELHALLAETMQVDGARDWLLDRLGLLFGHHLQPRPQVGAALLHLVAQLAPAEGGEGGIAELPPGSAQPLLQGADIGIEDLRLVHSAGISTRDRATIRSDSLADAYSVTRRTAGKTDDLKADDLEPGERAHHGIVA